MADLNSLIRLKKYKVDEMQRALAELNTRIAELEKQRNELLAQIVREQKITEESQDINMDYGAFAKAALAKREMLESHITAVEGEIAAARDHIKDAFAELKKFEMTQEARDALAEEERKLKENQELDEIGLETHRRRKDD